MTSLQFCGGWSVRSPCFLSLFLFFVFCFFLFFFFNNNKYDYHQERHHIPWTCLISDRFNLISLPFFFPFRDLGLTGANKLDNRPELSDVSRAFKSARLIAYIGALVLTFVLIILWPAVMVAVGVMDLSGFQHWVSWVMKLPLASQEFLRERILRWIQIVFYAAKFIHQYKIKYNVPPLPSTYKKG